MLPGGNRKHGPQTPWDSPTAAKALLTGTKPPALYFYSVDGLWHEWGGGLGGREGVSSRATLLTPVWGGAPLCPNSPCTLCILGWGYRPRGFCHPKGAHFTKGETKAEARTWVGDMEMLGSPLTGPSCQAQDPCPCYHRSPPSSLLLAMKTLERRLSTGTPPYGRAPPPGQTPAPPDPSLAGCALPGPLTQLETVLFSGKEFWDMERGQQSNVKQGDRCCRPDGPVFRGAHAARAGLGVRGQVGAAADKGV